MRHFLSAAFVIFQIALSASGLYIDINDKPSFSHNIDAFGAHDVPKLMPKYRDQPLTVHLVPHSHDDVGWLMTPDEYYERRVKHIYNHVLDCMLADTRRRFIIVEQAFFSRWFGALDHTRQRQVRRLLDQGRFEFVSGGWVMNDEACTTETAIFNQMTLGQQYVHRTFGKRVRFGYQIDPFGHSAANALMFEGLGFEAMIINRIHYSDKEEREVNKTMEFQWQPQGRGRGILTHILDAHYSSPRGFDFEQDPEIGDHAELVRRSRELVAELLKRASYYPSETDFLQLIGDDFRFINAQVQFKNWDRIIDHVNKHSKLYGVELRYSTLSEYFDAVAKQNIEYSVYQGDFFPYADNQNSYWSGYFTSKPVLKRVARDAENWLRLAEIKNLQLKFVGGKNEESVLDPLRKAVAEVQHHDGITGTAKRHVSDMYVTMMKNGIKRAESVVVDYADRMYGGNDIHFSFDLHSLKSLKSGELVPVLVSNALSKEFQGVVRLPCFFESIEVYDHKMKPVRFQLMSSFKKSHIAPFDLYVEASAPAFSESVYWLKRTNGRMGRLSTHNQVHEHVELKNGRITVSIDFDPMLRREMKIEDHSTGTKATINPWLWWYKSSTDPDQPSGAYIFRTEGYPSPLSFAAAITTFVSGPLVDEFRIVYSENYAQMFRVYKVGEGPQSMLLEIEALIGYLFFDQEAVMRVGEHRNMTECNLYSDDNGMLNMKRGPPKSHIEANFYPMAVYSSLECSDHTINMWSDRSIAVGHVSNGIADLMLHRRTSRDDRRGVDERLDDTSVIRTHTFLSLSPGLDDALMLGMSSFTRHPPVALFGTTRRTPHKFNLVRDRKQVGSDWRLLSIQQLEHLSDSGNKKQLLVRVQCVEESCDDLESNIGEIMDHFLDTIPPDHRPSVHRVHQNVLLNGLRLHADSNDASLLFQVSNQEREDQEEFLSGDIRAVIVDLNA